MIVFDYLNPKMAIADKGKVLNKGEIYTSVVYLGKDEDISNWAEINEEDIPSPETEKEENNE